MKELYFKMLRNGIEELRTEKYSIERNGISEALQITLNNLQEELKLLNIPPVIDFLTLRQVAYKYGEKISCEVVCPKGVEWKQTELIVSAIFLKQMEQGSIRNCR